MTSQTFLLSQGDMASRRNVKIGTGLSATYNYVCKCKFIEKGDTVHVYRKRSGKP
jgi:hypothetical protein